MLHQSRRDLVLQPVSPNRCPKEVYPHVPTVISICLRYLTYDPNYNFDDEDEDDNAMDAEQNDEDYQGPKNWTELASPPGGVEANASVCPSLGSDDEYSDDDDMSWKVRRAAAKCLDAVVSTRHEMLPEFYRSVSPALVCRFKVSKTRGDVHTASVARHVN